MKGLQTLNHRFTGLIKKLSYCSLRYEKEAYLFVAFFFANVFLLVNNGIFWDDWTVFNMETAGLLQQFDENGYGFMVYVHMVINGGTYSPMLYHWMSFFFLFGAYVFVYRILKQFSVDDNSAFLITLLALSVPYFEARNTMICMPYAMFFFSWCWGLYLVFGYFLERQGLKKLALGVVLLFFSFFMNSLIPMFLCVYALFFFVSNDFSIAAMKSKSRREMLSHIGLLALPLLFWGFKKTFFPVKGLYASNGYNVIDLSIEKMPLQFEKIFTYNIVGIYDELVLLLKYDVDFGIFATVMSAAVCTFVVRRARFEIRDRKNTLFYALTGVLLFFVGAFPYVVINKLPQYYGYETRLQILLPIGVALFAYALVLLVPLFLRKTFYFLFLAIFMVNTAVGNINFLRGWIKMEAMMLEFKKLDLGKGGVILTYNFGGQLSATERITSNYELSGMAKKSFGRQDWYFIHPRLVKDSADLVPLDHSIKFNMKDYKKSNVKNSRSLHIKFNKQYMEYCDVLRLSKLYYSDKEVFEIAIDSILDLRIE